MSTTTGESSTGGLLIGPRGVVLVLTLAPAAALACAACTNALLHLKFWPLAAEGPVLLVLAVEAVVASRPPVPAARVKRAARSLLSLGLLGAALGLFVSTTLGGLALIGALLIRAVLIGAATWTTAPRWVGARAVLAGVALMGCVLAHAPSLRGTAELIGAMTESTARFVHDSWVLDELRSRGPEALQVVEAGLVEGADEPARSRMLSLLELHARLGGVRERRLEACARARAWRGTGPRESSTLDQLCGEAPR